MRIVIIGAGVAGLYAAYRATQQGHTVTVLEAKDRPGGLSHTARTGSTITEVHDGQHITQTAALSPGQFVNLGPGRLPHHHRRILRLCSELAVPLEPYVMSSDANLYCDAETGQTYPRRRIEHDMRGHLAAVAHASGALGYEQRELARAFGDLTGRGAYTGTHRAPGKPLTLDEISAMGAWRHQFFQPDSHLWQGTMFHPVGGMDAIWQALLARMIAKGVDVRLSSPVTGIRTGATGVRVRWLANGGTETGEFDWCLSSIPWPLLDDTQLDGFSTDYTRAVASVGFAAACKVGWETTSRWWQDDPWQIYGGISYTSHDIWQVWYPSTGWDQQRGTLTGAYNSYGTAERFGRLSVDERLALARQGGQQLHPEIGDDNLTPLHLGMTVAWHRVPFQAGGWADWQPDNPRHAEAFARLQEPDGRFIAIGDQIGDWPGWQEGCVQSVDRALGHVGSGTFDLGDGWQVRRGGISYAIEDEYDLQPTGDVPDAHLLTAGDYPRT